MWLCVCVCACVGVCVWVCVRVGVYVCVCGSGEETRQVIPRPSSQAHPPVYAHMLTMAEPLAGSGARARASGSGVRAQPSRAPQCPHFQQPSEPPSHPAAAWQAARMMLNSDWRIQVGMLHAMHASERLLKNHARMGMGRCVRTPQKGLYILGSGCRNRRVVHRPSARNPML